MTHPIRTPKKLIEVALPLDAINVASAREKSIRHGHPSTLHLYWARRPLATARAVIFSQMVNDPSWRWEFEQPGVEPPNNLKATWAKSRRRLFGIIEELVKWENVTNETVLGAARAEIKKSWQETCRLNSDHPLAHELFDPERLPDFHDPFAGGGAIPLEAQRLGLTSHASDLNPVSVIINKAMIEIPPRFTGWRPVNAAALSEHSLVPRQWSGSQGLAEDVRHYGQWIRSEAEQRIGTRYPKVLISAEMAVQRPDLAQYVGQSLTVVAWLSARTVASPNPAFAKVKVPLISSFTLSPMADKEAYVEPIITGGDYRFTLRIGKPEDAEAARNGTKLGRGSNFRCLMSGAPISGDYIKAEGRAGRLGARMMAIVAEGERGRVYLAPTAEQEAAAVGEQSTWRPETVISGSTQYLGVKPYGMERFDQLFTERQLLALTTFSDLVAKVRPRIEKDALAAGLLDDRVPLRSGGTGAAAYADAVAVYLGFLVSKLADKGSTLCTWDAGPTSNKTASGRSARVATVRVTFGRQALPMSWDFAEVNFFSESVGSTDTVLKTLTVPLTYFSPALAAGEAEQADAMSQVLSRNAVVSTDPPYYDNVPYADLSDFFYVWLRRSLRSIYPDLFATVSVPKAEELVAFAYRHDDGRSGAESFFLKGMTQAMHRLVDQVHPAYPVTIYYAFKQAETDSENGTFSTGWETFLDAVIRAGFSLSGTWPMRTELSSRMRGADSNALASSVVLVCRPRASDAPTISRRQFTRELERILPSAVDAMTRGAEGWGSPVAPVDLSQAIIGPGMEVFTKYSAVLEADGTPMPVRTALTLINRFLADDDFDADTQFCVSWFEQNGWKTGSFGIADTLARAKGTSVEGVKSAGVLHSAGGSVRLTRPVEYPAEWHPSADGRIPVWEVLHHLIRALRADGEQGAAAVLGAMQSRAASARQLAYRLYTLCERAGWAEDARAYNELIASWSAIESATPQPVGNVQQTLFES